MQLVYMLRATICHAQSASSKIHTQKSSCTVIEFVPILAPLQRTAWLSPMLLYSG